MRYILYLVGLIALLTQTAPALSAPLPQAQEPYPFIGKSDSLREVLEVFGENVGIPVRLSEKVKGKVDIDSTADTRLTFLNRLGSRHNFIWFYDGGILHVSSIYDMQTKFLSLTQWSSYQMKQELQKLGVWDTRFITMPESGARTLIVTGPEVYITLIQNAVTEITKSQPQKARVIVGMEGVGGGGLGGLPSLDNPESFADEYAIEGLINQPLVGDSPPDAGIGAGDAAIIGNDG